MKCGGSANRPSKFCTTAPTRRPSKRPGQEAATGIGGVLKLLFWTRPGCKELVAAKRGQIPGPLHRQQSRRPTAARRAGQLAGRGKNSPSSRHLTPGDNTAADPLLESAGLRVLPAQVFPNFFRSFFHEIPTSLPLNSLVDATQVIDLGPHPLQQHGGAANPPSERQRQPRFRSAAQPAP